MIRLDPQAHTRMKYIHIFLFIGYRKDSQVEFFYKYTIILYICYFNKVPNKNKMYIVYIVVTYKSI